MYVYVEKDAEGRCRGQFPVLATDFPQQIKESRNSLSQASRSPGPFLESITFQIRSTHLFL
jgi:hypothetical protein